MQRHVGLKNGKAASVSSAVLHFDTVTVEQATVTQKGKNSLVQRLIKNT